MMETLSIPRNTKARKEHRCDFCNEKITVGESYQKSTHVHEGHIYDWKTHNRCSRLAYILNLHEDGEGVSCDQFMRAVSEKYNEILIDIIPYKTENELDDFFRQLKIVSFHHRLWFVILYYREQLEKDETERIDGEVIKMGTMYVDDELLTGVFVMCERDDFNEVTTNLLYRDVKITPVEDSDV